MLIEAEHELPRSMYLIDMRHSPQAYGYETFLVLIRFLPPHTPLLFSAHVSIPRQLLFRYCTMLGIRDQIHVACC